MSGARGHRSGDPAAASPPWWRRGAGTVWLPTAGEMAALDRRAVESGAIPERALIENAGREVARRVAARFGDGPVVALAGSGHNGADALVALRTLSAWGWEVAAVLCGSGPPSPDVLRGWEIDLAEPGRLPELGAGAAVLLDGILGTGLTEAPRDPQASRIAEANELGRPVVAVDGPSGADLTSGAVRGACVRADITCTLGWPKVGLLREPARGHAGRIVSLEIGFPPPSEPLGARAITARWIRSLLPRRAAGSHKGESGYVAVVAGQRGMAGASVLAARGASRGGAGIVRVVGDPANRAVVQSSVPEGIFQGWDDREGVDDALAWADALVVGPGLGRGEDRRSLVSRVLEGAGPRPVVLDADGLNVWEGRADELAGRLPDGAVLTPHPGELARLMEGGIDEIVSDPLEAARAAARRFGATVLLKGAPTVVAPADGPVRVSPFMGPELATGGTGDVLSGLVGALLAAGASPADAAASALFLAGLAASRSDAPVGHLSGDIPGEIPRAREDVLAAAGPSRDAVNFILPAPRRR